MSDVDAHGYLCEQSSALVLMLPEKEPNFALLKISLYSVINVPQYFQDQAI